VYRPRTGSSAGRPHRFSRHRGQNDPPQPFAVTRQAAEKEPLMPEHKIVLIEDDREIQNTLKTVLEGVGYEVHVASNGIDGQRLIQAEVPDLVVTDMMMPRMGGFPVLEFLKTLDDPPHVIMITANEGGRHKAYAEMLGAVDYLRKPFAMDVLIEAVRKALEPEDPEPEGKKKTAKSTSKGPLRKRVAKKKAKE
jgi:DNA-binding response OmpR family regulator